MKRLILTTSLLTLFVYKAIAQTFFIEKTKDGYEQPILDKLIELNKNTRSKPENSDYTIRCIISQKGSWGIPTEGYIVIVDSKTEDIILKCRSVKLTNNIFKGFQNPRWLLMARIADNYLKI